MKPAVAPAGAPGEGGSWDPTSIIGNIMQPRQATEQPAAPATEQPAAPATEQPAAPVVRAAPAREPAVEKEVEHESSIPLGVLPVTEKKEAPPPERVEDDDPVPSEVEHGSQKAKNAWSQTKAEKKALKEKVKELESELAKRSDQPKPPEMQKLLEMQTQIEQYEQRLGQLDLTQTKNFKTRFDIPMERTKARVTAYMQKAGFTPDEAKDLSARMLTADTQELQQLVSDQPVPVQGAIYNLVQEYSQMSQDREEAVTNWRQTRLAIDHEAAIDQDISLAKDIERDTATAVSAALEAGNWMYKTTDGKSPEWDSAVKERTETVKGLLRTATQADLVKYVVEGITARPLRELLMKEKQRADGLAEELQRRQSMRPRIQGGSPSVVPAAPIKARSPESFLADM